VIIFALSVGRKTLQSGGQDLLEKRPCAMHVDVSILPFMDQSSHIDTLIIVRWAKACAREALACEPQQ
jgi:hypothetical protein